MRTVSNQSGDQQAVEQAQTRGSAKPIPDGTKLVAKLMPTRKDGRDIEEVEYAKEGVHAGLPAVSTRWEIVEAPYRGRNIFGRILLARRFKPNGNAKYPDGAPNRLYVGLAGIAGVDVAANAATGRDDVWPQDAQLIGLYAEIVVRETAPDDRNPEGGNEVQFINPVDQARVAAALASTGTNRPATASNVPWGNAPAANGAAPAQAPWGASAPTAAQPQVPQQQGGAPWGQQAATPAPAQPQQPAPAEPTQPWGVSAQDAAFAQQVTQQAAPAAEPALQGQSF